MLSSSSSLLLRSRAGFRSMSVLVVGEHAGGKLSAGTLSVVTAASKLQSGAVTLLVAGADADAVAQEAAKVSGVSEVVSAKDAQFDHGNAESMAALVVALQGANGYSHVLACATNEGKNIVPRAGAMLGVQPVSDVIGVVSADTFVRPIYAGNALATVQSLDKVKCMTVRSTAFEKANAEGGSAKISAAAAVPAPANKAVWKEDRVARSERPELTSASRIVSGGRGLKSAENFKLVYALADKLGAAVGASRAAVDAGYAANELQVGQTGKVVAPELYIAVGISGAIQHLAGMKDSKCIVAINKDPEAPIFQVADYGLEADLFTAVPELTKKL